MLQTFEDEYEYEYEHDAEDRLKAGVRTGGGRVGEGLARSGPSVVQEKKTVMNHRTP